VYSALVPTAIEPRNRDVSELREILRNVPISSPGAGQNPAMVNSYPFRESMVDPAPLDSSSL
jgi:hypothetical protein